MEDLKQKIQSKIWKERQEAYIQLIQSINRGTKISTDIFCILAHETNIPVLESAFPLLLKQEQLSFEDTKTVLRNLATPKTSLRVLIHQYISKILDEAGEKNNHPLVFELINLLGGNPKMMREALICLGDITEKYGLLIPIEEIPFSKIFGHADAQVRKEAMNFCIKIYQKKGEMIYKYLKNIKPILLEELKSEALKYDNNHINVNVIKPNSEEIQNDNHKNEITENKKAENILITSEITNKKLSTPNPLANKPNDKSSSVSFDTYSEAFFRSIKSEKWSDRVEALTKLTPLFKAQSSDLCNHDLTKIFIKCCNDPNNQVVITLCENLALLSPNILNNLPYKKELIHALIVKLKDRKQTIISALKNVLEKWNCLEDLCEFLKDKNPQIKANVVGLIGKQCKKVQLDSEILKNIVELLNDGNSDVRKETADALSIMVSAYGSDFMDKYFVCLPKTKLELIKTNKRVDEKKEDKKKESTKREKEGEIKKEENMQKDIELKLKRPSLQKSEIEQCIDYMTNKYLFLLQKDWNKRLEGFNGNLTSLKKESVRKLIIFFTNYKEPIHLINARILELLKNKINDKLEEGLAELLADHYLEKITDMKLKNSVIELIERLTTRDSNIIKIVIGYCNKKKFGKGFVAGLDLLGILTRYDKHKIIEKYAETIHCSGREERDAIKRLKERKDEMINNNVIPTPENIEGGIKHNDDNPKDDISNNDFRNDKINPSLISDIKESNIVRKEILDDNPFIDARPTSNLSFKRRISHTRPKIIKNVIKKRIKNGMRMDDVFTEEFLAIYNKKGISQDVLDGFETTDKILISDYILKYCIEHDMNEEYLENIIGYFIAREYVLSEYEIRICLEYFITKRNEDVLSVMEQVYPLSKLFIVYQRILKDKPEYKDFIINEVFKLVKKNQMFRGNEMYYIDMMKEDDGIVELVQEMCKVNPGILGVIKDNKVFDGEFMSPCGKKGKFQEDEIINNNEDMIINNYDVITNDEGITNSDGIINDTASTPPRNNMERFRKEFESRLSITPRVDRLALEKTLIHLIDANLEISEKAFRKLNNIIDSNIQSIIFSSNSIISSILIQLNDLNENRNSLFYFIVNILLKLVKNKQFCDELSFEALKTLNYDLIRMMCRSDDIKNESGCAMKDINLGDVLVNMCLNVPPIMMLRVYLSLVVRLVEEKASYKEILLKLTWRHSKGVVKYVKDRSIIEDILMVLQHFYENTPVNIFKDDILIFKIIQLHLTEIVKFYGTAIREFKMKGLIRVYIESLLSGDDVIDTQERIEKIRDSL
ncbi:Phosphoprotein p93 [Astathelohania contejeani]|uniref:Phosphoprotein p93 n=1 Tax=Astathelohania contejeani TaxID=164912 RepID=A0ABQ7I0C3_9MICR|nr:Phosphoprotein p93 [Thelohania contejeani]